MAVAELDDRRLSVLDALGDDSPVRTSPTRPAAQRYTGVLYKELDPSSLSGTALRRFNSNVLVVSGLWGLVAPKDLIPEYRLKMSASLAGLGKMSTWWRPFVTDALEERVRRAVVWDLLPKEHAAAIDWNRLEPRRRVTVTFLDRDGRTVSHWNKLLKGSIVRWLAETGERDPEALGGFDHPQGYRVDPASSDLTAPHASVVMREQWT